MERTSYENQNENQAMLWEAAFDNHACPAPGATSRAIFEQLHEETACLDIKSFWVSSFAKNEALSKTLKKSIVHTDFWC